MAGKSYEIWLRAARENLPRFYEFMAAVGSALALDDKTRFDVELASEEAITNIITHAYAGRTDGEFVVRVTQDNNQIQVVIRDWGKQFDPTVIPPFDYSLPVEARIKGGMGMHFMRRLMDSVEYLFDEHNGTTLTMTKSLNITIPESVVSFPRPEMERELQVFEEVGWALTNARDVDALLTLIVDKLTEVVDADRGTLYLIDPKSGELVSKILQDDTGRLTEIRLKIGQGIAGHVAETGETLNIFSTKDSPYFARHIDRSSGYLTKTVLCTPMHNANKEIIGVIQLLNKKGGDGVFTPRDETILKVLAAEAAIAIENARLLASEQSKRQLADTLREVSTIINSALELQKVLDLILQELERVIPFDGGAILLIDGENLAVRAIRGYPGKNAAAHPPVFKISENVLFQEIMSTRKPIIIPDVEKDPRWIRIETTEGSHAFMGVPLTVGDRVIGELGITSAAHNFYAQEQVEVAQTFANQAAAAIERARLHQQTVLQARLQQEVETAKSIQSSFLPDSDPYYPGWEISASWQPAREVAGDFYDFFDLPDGRLGFVIADVCGKGVPAALFMALSRTIFRVMALSDASTPDKLLEEVNDQIRENNRASLFVTLFYGILDPVSGELDYGNGGHNPPIFLQTSGDYALLEAGGPALGIFPNVTYQAGKLALQPGDVLVSYTDGVTEAIDLTEEEYGEARLIDCVSAHSRWSARQISLAITAEVHNFTSGQPPVDDATVLVIKRIG